MSVISDASKVVSDEMLKVLKQRQKRFLSNFTKAINGAEMSIKNETNVSKIALLRKNEEFSIFKLQKNLDDLYLHASRAAITIAQQLSDKIMKEQIWSLYDVKGL